MTASLSRHVLFIYPLRVRNFPRYFVALLSFPSLEDVLEATQDVAEETNPKKGTGQGEGMLGVHLYSLLIFFL